MGFSDEQLQGYGTNDRLAVEVAANRAARKKEVDIRLPSVVRQEWARLGGSALAPGVDPVTDPSAAADALERPPTDNVVDGGYGKYSDQPGWMNADQWAQAGIEYARAPGGISEDRYRRSQFLQTPQRYQYMQEGPGRLLAALREKNPDRALYFFDKSNNARTTRDDYNDANYGQFGGFAPGASALITGVSPLAAHLRNQAVIPNAILNAPETGLLKGLERAHANYNLASRVMLSPNSEQEVLDLPSDATPEAASQRRKFLSEMADLLAPQSGKRIASSVWNASSALGDTVGTALYADGKAPIIRGRREAAGAPAAYTDAVETMASMADATLVPDLAVHGPIKGLITEAVGDSPFEIAQRHIFSTDPNRTYAGYLSDPTAPYVQDKERLRRAEQAAAAVQGMTADSGGLLGALTTEPEAWGMGGMPPAASNPAPAVARPQSLWRSRQDALKEAVSPSR